MSIGTLAPDTYYQWARRGRVFSAFASLTSPVAYTTATGMGGPLIWNNSGTTFGNQGVYVIPISVSVACTTATSAPTSVGITGATGQTAAPTSTTTIDASGNTNIGQGRTSQVSVYNKGTVTNAGTFFHTTHSFGTGAITTLNILPVWVDIQGVFICSPGDWIAVSTAGSAPSGVIKVGLLWIEVPID